MAPKNYEVVFRGETRKTNLAKTRREHFAIFSMKKCKYSQFTLKVY